MNDVYRSAFDKITLSSGKKQEILRLTKESKYSHKRYSIPRLCAIPATCVVLLLFVMSDSAKIYAERILHELAGLIYVNEGVVDLGESEWLKIKMPDDMESLEFEGVTYQYKTYDTLASLEKELEVDFLDFASDYKVKDEQVKFQVENDEAGKIHMLMERESAENHNLPISYTLFFSASEGTSTGNLSFKDVRCPYISYDVEGEEKVFRFQQEYEVVEKYRSANLNTDVLILRETDKQTKDEHVDTRTTYYVIFVYEEAEYQLCFHSDLSSIKDVVEDMK